MAKIILMVSLIVLAGFTLESRATEGFDELKTCLGSFKSQLDDIGAQNFGLSSDEALEQFAKTMEAVTKLMDGSADCFALAERIEDQLTSAEKAEIHQIIPESSSEGN